MSGRLERPASVADALALLAEGARMPLAGGTDVYPAHVGRPIASPMVDLSRLDALRGIAHDARGWTIGATTTWSDVLRAPLPPLFDALKAAAREVGGVQIQNTGTVGGNVCHASPAADGMPALLALGAEVELASAAGSRRLALDDFVLGPRRTARRADELLVALHVPAASAAARSAFRKLGSRRYLVISIAMVAALIDVDADGCVALTRIAVGACGPKAMRLPTLERRLLGEPVETVARLVDDGAADFASLAPIDDIRATAAYRREAARVLVRRALAELAEREAVAA